MSSHVTASYRRRLRSRNSAIRAAQLHSCKLLQGIQFPEISPHESDADNDAYFLSEGNQDPIGNQLEHASVDANSLDFSLLHTVGTQTSPMPHGTWIHAKDTDVDAHSFSEGKPDSQRFQMGYSSVFVNPLGTIHLHTVSTQTVMPPPGTWIHECNADIDAHSPGEGKPDSQRFQAEPMSAAANSRDICHLHTVSTQTCLPPAGTCIRAGDNDMEAHSFREDKPDLQGCHNGLRSVFACTLGVNILYTAMMESETRQEWQRVLEICELFQISGLQPRIEAISAASNACYHLGHWKQALDLFDSMVYLCSILPHQFGGQPHQEILDNAVSACWNLGLWAKASQIREYMKRLGMQTITNSLNDAISACENPCDNPTVAAPHIE
eukprot:CAMPEP_0197624424 /NCGR_PEP_ID=MMETSP1338-20131121/4068_1 /TAXON_ID=43686 ORGANISM="Pelagodinium beii, Strain RCC1491" /NCGR_SAMPLE_ID=MMETSP1338 /ASSEMBLY_ACC=CAM_ASM_000754 /LENGTH=380 /DNA_ID=CAMNT_0043194561 /DNA_START=79 /DNA_END=1221 /DNA_ORIENTATION=-